MRGGAVIGGSRWLFSMSGLILVFGFYYAPYVYMFTASALRNMDPSLEEASEVSGASAFTTIFTVTFPLIAPAILAGSLLSFVVMLGIYGVPAALGCATSYLCSGAQGIYHAQRPGAGKAVKPAPPAA